MISLKNIHYNYPKGRMVLKNVSVTFEKGNIYGLFGKNGEGKSTLLKIMSGLLNARSGRHYINGKGNFQRNAQTLQHLFLVPEDFELPPVSIATYQRINGPFYPNFSQHQFDDLISEFKLSQEQHISKLSFGQKKKVLIAFGIAANTPLLLMDEPTNGLDIPSKSQFRKIMATIADADKCIIISTHQVRDLHSLIDHIVVLDDSQVVFDTALELVAEQLWFGKANIPTDDIIYTEAGFGGKSVALRGTKDESEIDLELLFAAVLNQNVSLKKIIKNTGHDQVF